MPEAYTRQSSFSNGDVIDAPLFNAEFDQLELAFNESSGHDHDGTPAGGASVPLIKKETTSVSIDTSVPTNHKIKFTLNDVVVREFTEETGDSLGNTSAILHTPDVGAPEQLNTYLDALALSTVGAVDAAQAAAEVAEDAAEAAEGYAATVGVPIIVAEGDSYVIAENQPVLEVVCLGNATITFPESPFANATYIVKSTKKDGVVTGILGTGHQISDLKGVLQPSFTIEGFYQLDAHWLGAGVYRGF